MTFLTSRIISFSEIGIEETKAADAICRIVLILIFNNLTRV